MKRLAVLLAVLLAGSAFGAELVLQPGSEGKDSMVYDRSPTTNYGTSPYLMVNYGTGSTRGLVEFTGLSASAKGSTINSAKLEVYNNGNSGAVIVYRNTTSWGEMTVNWSNQPTHHATSYAVLVLTSRGKFSCDVKKLVNEWVQETYSNYGVKLTTYETNEPYPVSSDYATADYRPKLTVDYTPTAVAPCSVGKVKALFK